MRNELFTSGYRDPSDDAHRMVYYVSGALGFVGSLLGSFYFAALLIRGKGVNVESFPGESAPDYRLPLLLLALCLLSMVRIGLWGYPELKRMRGKKVTADAFVAGGFLAGLALLFLAMERSMLRGSSSQGAILVLIGLGIAVLFGSLVVGLLIAYLPKLSVPKTVEGVIVEARYAIDKRLMEIEDHPDPVGEECIPMVRLRTLGGKQITVRASAESYDLATPGMLGTARIAKGRLQQFRPSRRS